MNNQDKFLHFKNRLEKVYKHTSKWARKQGITCFRVYDDDMPEFPFAIDLYENLLHVAEYAKQHALTPEQHSEWLTECLQILVDVFDIPLQHIYLKVRQRQSGDRQYEKFDRKGLEQIVTEQGLRFIINPADYLDTGLFLDHRTTRQMVRAVAKDKSVLNLFAYTGSFSVYAAAGGAKRTDTLDLSTTYLQWARKNMELNGFTGSNHHFLQTDVLDWLNQPVTQRWDLIVLDPPTFSNSKRMRGTLDIQRDHVWLIHAALKRLLPGGQLYFSTNLRKFKLESDSFAGFQIKNISGQTIPNDFRDKKIHHCFLITH